MARTAGLEPATFGSVGRLLPFLKGSLQAVLALSAGVLAHWMVQLGSGGSGWFRPVWTRNPTEASPRRHHTRLPGGQQEWTTWAGLCSLPSAHSQARGTVLMQKGAVCIWVLRGLP